MPKKAIFITSFAAVSIFALSVFATSPDHERDVLIYLMEPPFDTMDRHGGTHDAPERVSQ